MDAAARVVGSLGEDTQLGGVAGLSDDGLLGLLTDATEARNALDLVIATASAEAHRRSSRDLGYDGLAQRRGHRNGTSLVQNITGLTRADVNRAVKTGEDLDSRLSETPPLGDPDAAVTDAVPPAPRWLSVLRNALAGGRIGQAQFQAIRIGLGEPPVDRYPQLDPEFLPEAWRRAVEILLDESAIAPVEELRAAARIARDRLDPIGVTLRFEERFAARSFRTWVDETGQHHARIVFDDEAAAWVHSILGAALRPRRGPRFVSTDAFSKVTDTDADQRTNEQLQYDTIVAVLRTGAAADPQQAFGDRQPGIRILLEASAITKADTRGGMHITGVGHLEDSGQALPAGVAEKYLCDAGAIAVIHDEYGRPLDVGREQRLFTSRQRIAIGARDGGCIWPSCIAPLSECEYHHLDHWWEHHGKTDVDDGVPLCRNCHLRLHNQGWRITRERDPNTGIDTYLLHPPPDPMTGANGEPIRLTSKSPRRFDAA